MLFQDDFSDVNSGWDRARSEEGDSADSSGGKYRIYIKSPNNDFWANPNSLSISTGVTIEVDAERTFGPEMGTYGVVCGYQNQNNFHALTIANDGFVEIYKYVDGIFAQVTAVEYSSRINPVGVNHLTASCAGRTLILSVNGSQVARGTRDDLRAGNVGLIASAFHDADAEFLFDNFTVTEKH